MRIIVKTTPEELRRARTWWKDLEGPWKMAHNEAVFGKGPVLAPPTDDELMYLLIGADTLRYAGPTAINPNVSTALTNLSGLIPLYQLTYLSFTNMAIEGVRELRRFTRLKYLFLYENRLTSLQGIEGMLDLEELQVQNNRLASLKPVTHLTKLRTLYATRNAFTRIDGLTAEHARAMKRFYIQPNDQLPDRELIRIQHELGILCRSG